jgi:putative acyl-CoA dehydrogenase
MGARDPVTRLATHTVENQPPPLEGYNLYDSDPALREALQREGASWAEDKVRALGEILGAERTLRLGEQANRYVPELVTFDRFGQRIDEVEYHPAYHELLGLVVEHEVPSIAWTERRVGGHAAHTALSYLVAQTESGICCPATMTYASIPTLRQQTEVAAEWEPGVLSTEYDPRSMPAKEKTGLTIGMAMTEKQGGSDVRGNTTRARRLGPGGPGEEYELTGHKWFCSAPMSDAFLALAYTEKDALSCFLVPRWRPDGTRNPMLIQRLKDKLGNRSNASSEIEYDRSWGRMVGEEGRGVRTIIEMVHHTRLDTVGATAALMRQAVRQAVHHTDHRRAFGRLLADQPLMRNVLADLALEAEASVALAMRLARAFDEAQEDDPSRVFARIATAVAKYWINKRVTGQVCEALECHGGGGYVEESIMARLYREAPLNSIWEGSGNVICLDVLRAMHREPESVAAFLGEIELARGGNRHLDRALDELRRAVAEQAEEEARARWLTERMALALEGALLVRHAPDIVADAFCASRLGTDLSRGYGTLPGGTDFGRLIERARVQVT